MARQYLINGVLVNETNATRQYIVNGTLVNEISTVGVVTRILGIGIGLVRTQESKGIIG